MKKKLKVLSLFSGIGSFEKALSRSRIPYELMAYCEIDKFASRAYSLIHDVSEEFNLWDVRRVNGNSFTDTDLLVFGFPCQSISIAGKQSGIKLKCVTCNNEFSFNSLGSNNHECCPNCNGIDIYPITESGLFYEGLRILKQTKPKYCVIENVKALTLSGFKNEFHSILKSLEDSGYNVFWKILNSKNYGIPQNRERVFIVCFRKDINQYFDFPNGFDTELRLKDLLEPNPNENYYMSLDKSLQLTEYLKKNDLKVLKKLKLEDNGIIKVCDIPKEILNDNERQRRVYGTNGIAPTVLARSDSAKIITLGMLDMRGGTQVRNVYSSEGISPTIDTAQGGHRQPKVLVRTLNGIDLLHSSILTDDYISLMEDVIYRVRKLTPFESLRLMGFDNYDYNILREHNFSDTQLYKVAGNSIVVDVLEYIFQEMFK